MGGPKQHRSLWSEEAENVFSVIFGVELAGVVTRSPSRPKRSVRWSPIVRGGSGQAGIRKAQNDVAARVAGGPEGRPLLRGLRDYLHRFQRSLKVQVA
jgi:hypothetical protein